MRRNVQGFPRFSHHFVVQLLFCIYSGGFSFASTTGYYLPALRADAHYQP
jgi:hypothetical protein